MSLNAKLRDAIKNIAKKHKAKMESKKPPTAKKEKPAEDDNDDSY